MGKHIKDIVSKEDIEKCCTNQPDRCIWNSQTIDSCGKVFNWKFVKTCHERATKRDLKGVIKEDNLLDSPQEHNVEPFSDIIECHRQVRITMMTDEDKEYLGTYVFPSSLYFITYDIPIHTRLLTHFQCDSQKYVR